MTNLTDKWIKGELPSGWYWVELKEGTFVDGKKSIILDYLFDFTNDFERHPYLVESVLAEVPSYEQWVMTKNLSERAHLEMYKARGEKVRLEKENTKLKELLKEVQSKIRYSSPQGIETFADLDDTLLGKINQLLGEE